MADVREGSLMLREKKMELGFRVWVCFFNLKLTCQVGFAIKIGLGFYEN